MQRIAKIVPRRALSYCITRCDLTGVPLNGVAQTTETTPPPPLTPATFALAMQYHKLRRGFMITTPESKQPLDQFSHQLFAQLHESILPVLDKGHEALFIALGARTRLLFMAGLWNTTRGAGSGGVRYKSYDTVYDQAFDTLRLARGMGHKNALAALHWGGGKGTIAQEQLLGSEESSVWRRQVFEDWGEFVTSLRGAYYTAEDVGTTVNDMKIIASATRFVNCIPEVMGGSGNPSHMTARGIACALQAAVNFAGFDMRKMRVAVQGIGNVGGFLIDELLAKGVRSILATDVDATRLLQAQKRFGDRVRVQRETPDSSALFADVDIVAPCALGGILNDDTIPRVRARIICGGANNQLLDPERHDAMLHAQGKIYIPDFIANKAGIINCADEMYGYVGANRLQDPLMSRYFVAEGPWSIQQQVKDLLDRCMEQGQPTGRVAVQMANEACEQPHPLWPGRARQILIGLVKDSWQGQNLVVKDSCQN